MVSLGELSNAELEYLRSKWDSEATELKNERQRKAKRLDDRLARQAEDGTGQTVLENEKAHAEAVLNLLVASNADASLIAEQQTIVAEIQAKMNELSSGTSYLSKTDALLLLMELDELESQSDLREDQVANIDDLIGT